MTFSQLTPEEKHVIIDKGTERSFTGKYFDFFEKGLYTCKQCNAILYKSEFKFESHCGWPSFDDEIADAVKKVPDKDGRRTEIICNNCDGHLGHIFTGEGYTEKNLRHCVNSISMNFIPENKYELAVFASGCFWGTQYIFQDVKGVLGTQVGYTGGSVSDPSYKEVCNKIKAACEFHDIKLLDFLIIIPSTLIWGYYSFLDEGIL